MLNKRRRSGLLSLFCVGNSLLVHNGYHQNAGELLVVCGARIAPSYMSSNRTPGREGVPRGEKVLIDLESILTVTSPVIAFDESQRKGILKHPP